LRQILNILIMLTLVLAAAACRKVPLRDDAGSISHGSIHWFENEKTAFLFFSIAEAPERLTDPVYEYSWVGQTKDGGTVSFPLTEIDLSSAVHEHALVSCGGGAVCGSFSFPAEYQLVSAFFQFRYDRSSDQALQTALSPFNHAAGSTADAYSALLYGVFDKDNGHTQVRVHHNFGTPASDEIARFGMTRRFQVSDPVLFEPADADTIDEHRETVGSPLMFPASFCQGAGAAAKHFTGDSYWQDTLLDPATGARGACFNTRYLDRNSKPVLEADLASYAFRNPEVADSTLSFRTPLVPVNEIPVFVKVCDDEPSASGMIDQEFLTYQKFILGMVNRPEDLCFRIGGMTDFKQDFEKHIADRLVAAKTANQTGGDFMFIVLLHEKFSEEFLVLQGIVADALTSAVKTEELYVSPRLVGSMIYSGSTHFTPSANQRKYITWCPQELLAGFFDPLLGSQNCVTSPSGDLDLTVINFVAPMGALPSLADYKRYVKEYGDAGLARNPDLAFYSPLLSANSQVEVESRITFFDSQRFSLAAGEYAKVCSERLDRAVTSFYVRTPDQPKSIESIPLFDMNASWLSDDAQGEYRIGIEWEFPYWGGIEYTSALTGKVVTVVPFQRSFKSYEALGDPKWQTETWNFGKYVQKCSKYCDNPAFDEAGIYQPQSVWRVPTLDRCQIPAPPIYPGGAT
jgi:hypothetical protein